MIFKCFNVSYFVSNSRPPNLISNVNFKRNCTNARNIYLQKYIWNQVELAKLDFHSAPNGVSTEKPTNQKYWNTSNQSYLFSYHFPCDHFILSISLKKVFQPQMQTHYVCCDKNPPQLAYWELWSDIKGGYWASISRYWGPKAK